MQFGPGRYCFASRQWSTVPASLAGAGVAFVGECVDDRGTATTDALKKAANSVFSVRFDAPEQATYLNGELTNRTRLSTVIKSAGRIVLDATTMGLGEIVQILLAARRADVTEIEILYAEPKEYTRHQSDSFVDPKLRYFQLTKNCEFCSIHGLSHEHEAGARATHVFLIGFEAARVLNAMEQRGETDRSRYRCHAVIGVPAFQPGWEANSIRPHLQVLAELDIKEHSISYCQANSIREAYLTLWELYGQLGDERRCFYVSPLGTKPHAVGAALFLLETMGADNATSLYYDHPVRVNKRSSKLATWHHVKVSL